MNVDRSLRMIAGGVVAASVLLGVYVSPNFLWFTLFVGLTRHCGVSRVLISCDAYCGRGDHIAFRAIG